ncbi:hypothetical protein PSNIH1_00620 [Pantoea sp. PSNIH1]|nr:hypothetical protein PSNIH1_00620 [Pantoea sp. PSNIH1]
MKAIAWSKSRRSFWFRLFGYGLNVIDRSVFPPLYSTRKGLRKEIRIGKFGVHILSRSQIKKRPA